MFFTSIGNITVITKAAGITNNDHLKDKNAVIKSVKKKNTYLLNIFVTNKKKPESNKRPKGNILKTNISTFSPITKAVKTRTKSRLKPIIPN